MGDSYIHFITIKTKTGEYLLKKIEARYRPGRGNESCPRKGVHIKFEVLSEDQCFISDNDNDDLSIAINEDQKNLCTLSWYLTVSDRVTEKTFIQLLDNDEILKTYIRLFSAQNIGLRGIDLAQNRLQYDVWVHSGMELESLKQTCVGPLIESIAHLSLVEESKTCSDDGEKLEKEKTLVPPNESDVHPTGQPTVPPQLQKESRSGHTAVDQRIDVSDDRKDGDKKVSDDVISDKFSHTRSRKGGQFSDYSRRNGQYLETGLNRSRPVRKKEVPTTLFDSLSPITTSSPVWKQNMRNLEQLDRNNYIIDGGNEDISPFSQSQENSRIDVMDRITWLRQMIVAMSQQGVKVKQVYVDLFPKFNKPMYYKYRFYQSKVTDEDGVIQLLVAMLDEDKDDSKTAAQVHALMQQFNPVSQAHLESGDHVLLECYRSDSKKSFHNHKSKKWTKTIKEDSEDSKPRKDLPERINTIDISREALDNSEKGEMFERLLPVISDVKVMDTDSDDAQSRQSSHFFPLPGLRRPCGSGFGYGDDIDDNRGGGYYDRGGGCDDRGGGGDDRGGGGDDRGGGGDDRGGGDYDRGGGDNDRGGGSDDQGGGGDGISDSGSEDRDRNDSDDDDLYATDEDDDISDVFDECAGVRTVPDGRADTSGNSSQSSGACLGESRQAANRHRLFLNFWNVTTENGDAEKCLCSTLDRRDLDSDPFPSTMFLLDYSKSMVGRHAEMKEKVERILQEAGSKRMGTVGVSETYGVAMFGRKTRILQPPTTDFRSVQEALDIQIQLAGRSPLGLGLLLCTCVWFADGGTGGTAWLDGRKIKPRIIVMTDMKVNETVNGSGEEMDDADDFQPETPHMMEVKNELIRIALNLKELGISVYLEPIGTCSDVRNHFEGVIEMTGGKVMGKDDQLGRRTWQEMMACNILQMVEKIRGPVSEANLNSMIDIYTGNEPSETDVVKTIMKDRQTQERDEAGIRWHLENTGEPGQRIWSGFPLGQRVLRGTSGTVVEGGTSGTVVAHFRSVQEALEKVLVHWDSAADDNFQTEDIGNLRKVNSARDCSEHVGGGHLVGSRVKIVSHEDGPIFQSSDVGTVITSSSRIQPRIVHVVWNLGSDRERMGRHCCYNISRFLEKDGRYPYDSFWMYCADNQWRPFPRTVSKMIEDKCRRPKASKSVLIHFHDQEYRLLFQKHVMRTTNAGNSKEFRIHKEAIMPP